MRSFPESPITPEIYDRLCHFYFLIDQKLGQGRIVQNDPWFRGWLSDYAGAWGSFLDTTASFSDEQLKSFKFAPRCRVEDSPVDGRPNEPSGWFSFNQFFARELNPGLRPIADPTLNTTVTAPADCIYKAAYPINSKSEVELTKSAQRLKLTHAVNTVPQLLGEKSASPSTETRISMSPSTKGSSTPRTTAPTATSSPRDAESS